MHESGEVSWLQFIWRLLALVMQLADMHVYHMSRDQSGEALVLNESTVYDYTYTTRTEPACRYPIMQVPKVSQMS